MTYYAMRITQCIYDYYTYEDVWTVCANNCDQDGEENARNYTRGLESFRHGQNSSTKRSLQQMSQSIHVPGNKKLKRKPTVVLRIQLKLEMESSGKTYIYTD